MDSEVSAKTVSAYHSVKNLASFHVFVTQVTILNQIE